MADKFEITLKKNGKKVSLPVDTLWLEDDGTIFPVPQQFSPIVPVCVFIAVFDKRFGEAMKRNTAIRYSKEEV